MTPEHHAALYFTGAHRSRRSYGSGDRLLALWCAWERAAEHLGRAVADSLADGRSALCDDYVAAYKVARDRENCARERFRGAYRARQSAEATS